LGAKPLKNPLKRIFAPSTTFKQSVATVEAILDQNLLMIRDLDHLRSTLEANLSDQEIKHIEL
jgi:hypothetical protein